MPLVLPVVLPLVFAAVALLMCRSVPRQRQIGVLGSAVHFASTLWLVAEVYRHGVLTIQIGNWPAPFGISLVADLFAAVLVALGGGLHLLVAVYAWTEIDEPRQAFGFYPLLNVLMMGVSGSFLTGDLFNLYVWFEVTLIASFVLLALGGERAQMVGAIKYVALNLTSSAFFLAAAGILYGTVHTLNMADLAVRLAEAAQTNRALVDAAQMLLVVSFGIKAAVFPLFFWVPESYPTPPPAIGAVFAGLLTKVGVYCLVRTMITIFPTSPGLYSLALVIAAFTMLTGVIGAVAQVEIRRILSFHSISQIGYMIMGLGLAGSANMDVRVLALGAALIYMLHHGIVKSNLFLIGGLVRRAGGSFELKPLGGLFTLAPGLAAVFLVTALSLAGLPPLSGFWAKFTVIKAGLGDGAYWVAAAALATGLLTTVSMIKIWNEAFWKPRPKHQAEPDASQHSLPLAAFGPPVALLAVTLAIGLYPQPWLRVGEKAAIQLLDRQRYVQAVLGDSVVLPESEPQQ